jgi:hypothetical protein
LDIKDYFEVFMKRKPSRTFLYLTFVMVFLFVVGLIVVGVLISNQNNLVHADCFTCVDISETNSALQTHAIETQMSISNSGTQSSSTTLAP